jgi:hypothetical protein
MPLLGESMWYARKFKSGDHQCLSVNLISGDCPYGPGIPHAITKDDVYKGFFIPKVSHLGVHTSFADR